MQVNPPSADEFRKLLGSAGQVTRQLGHHLLIFFAEPKSTKAIQKLLGLSHCETFLDNYLTPLLAVDLLKPIIPD